MKLAHASWASAATGFIALSYELVWMRAHAFATAGAAHAFSSLLGAYLLGLAVGAYVARRSCTTDAPGRAREALGAYVLASNLAAFLAVPLAGEIVRRAGSGFALPIYALVAALLGTNLPLLAHAALSADARAGQGIARLYLANIVGCAAGSLITGFLLMDVLSLHRTVAVLASLGGVVALMLLSRCPFGALGRGLGVVAVAVFAFFAGPSLHDGIYEKLQFATEYQSGMRFAEVIENRSGVITVTAEGKVYGGGVYDGGFNIDPVVEWNGIIRAYGVAAFHPKPKRMLVIGLGSGSWAQALAQHPDLESMTVIEINPGYFELAGRHVETRSLLTNPKVTRVVDDGRRWLHHHDERFDLIVQNSSFAWRAHATNLISVEYLELIRAHLLPGGVYYSNTIHQPSVQKTTAATFSYARRFRSFLAVSDAPMEVSKERTREILLGWVADGVALFNPAEAPRRQRIEEVLGAGDFEDRDSILRRTRDQPLITDDSMPTEWRW